MKALFSEYGRIVILFIAAGALIFYLFYAGTGGFRQLFLVTLLRITMQDPVEL